MQRINSYYSQRNEQIRMKNIKTNCEKEKEDKRGETKNLRQKKRENCILQCVFTQI